MVIERCGFNTAEGVAIEVYLGIDIGVTGAIAVRDTKYGVQEKEGWRLIDIPTFTLKNSTGGINTVYDIKKTFEIFQDLRGSLATIEDLHAIGQKPGKFGGHGAKANFSMGEGLMLIVAALTMNDIPIYRVAPATWKAKMLQGITDKSDKNKVLMRTQEQYPVLAPYLTRVKDHNRAEAVHILEYGRKFYYEAIS